MTRTQDALKDRKDGLHIARKSYVIGALTLLAAVAAVIVPFILANRSASPPEAQIEPGTLVVIRPDIGVGGAPLMAIPTLSQPVDYLPPAQQLRVDCFKEVDNKYALAHISGYLYTDKWVDTFALALPQGGDVMKAIADLGPCKF
jgi:hypothetical protein